MLKADEYTVRGGVKYGLKLVHVVQQPKLPPDNWKFGDDMLGNGRDLFQANLDSLFYGKFRGLCTQE